MAGNILTSYLCKLLIIMQLFLYMYSYSQLGIPLNEYICFRFRLFEQLYINHSYMCCDLAESVGSIDREIQPEKGMHVYCFLLF